MVKCARRVDAGFSWHKVNLSYQPRNVNLSPSSPIISSALKDLEKIAVAVRDGERSLRGFNLFAGEDLDLFQALLRGEFNISGFQNKHLAQRLQTAGRKVSWLLKRLRAHGLIKKIGHCYKYYLTALGRRVAAAALRLREMSIIPSLAAAHARG